MTVEPETTPPRMIHHFAWSANGNLIAAAEFESTVEIWSSATRERISRFETVLDYGGTRLAFTREAAPTLVAAAYTRRGVAAYDPHTGSERWTRRDIKGTQNIEPTPFGVAVGIERGALHLLDDVTGETLMRFSGTRRLYAGDGPYAIAEGTSGSQRFSLIDLSKGGEPIWKGSFLGFALHDAAIGQDGFAYSEAGSLLVHCHELDGTLRWRWVPPTDVGIYALAWLPDGRLAGVLKIERGTALITFGPDGAIDTTADLNGAAYPSFAPDGRHLLVSRQNDAGAWEAALLSVPAAATDWELWEPT